MRQHSAVFLCCLSLVATVTPAAAATAFASAGVQPRREDGLRIESQKVLLSRERVESETVLRNIGKDAVSMTMRLPTPTHAQGDSTGDALQDVSVQVDGKPVRTARPLSVRVAGKDVGWRIALHGWTEAEFLAWLKGGAAPAGKMPLPQGWFDEAGKPRFTVQRDYVWEQRLPKDRPVAVSVAYRPLLATSAAPDAATLASTLGKTGCIDANIGARLRQAQGANGLQVATLAFRPLGAVQWKGKAGTFTLRVRKSSDEELVWACMDGGRKLDGRTFEYRRTNFTPPARLDVRFAAGH